MVLNCQFLDEVAILPENQTKPGSFDDIDIWLGKIHADQYDIPRFMAILDNSEVERAAKFKTRADQLKFIITRSALRQILSLYIHQPPKQLKFNYGVSGKPTLENEEDHLYFNASHGGEWFAIGVSKKISLGVDIERIDNDFDYQQVTKNYFTIKEKEALGQYASRAARDLFFTLWTRKEAILKESGIGLTKEIGYINTLDGKNVCDLPDALAREHLDGEYAVTSFLPDEQHVVTLAVKGKNHPIRLMKFLPVKSK